MYILKISFFVKRGFSEVIIMPKSVENALLSINILAYRL